MNTLEEVLPPAVLRALGFTLLHSLWQGAVVGVAAALLLMALHRHRAAVRYWVAAGALGCLLLAAGLTGSWYYAAAAGQPAAAAAALPPASAVGPALVAPPLGGPATQPARVAAFAQAGLAYLEQHLPLLVTAWLLGMLAMLLRLLGSLAYVQRLRHYRVAALPAAWQQQLDALAERAGLPRRVQLLASALVSSPLVIGLFRPVVLLPLGLATGLPTRELEMILAHEVAHVLRRDYLFNLLQSVAETVFFYHPAVWYLGAALRTERENCCDDIAIRLYGDARLLAQALALVAELDYAAQRPPRPALALAAAGPTGSLLSRVRRLVRPTPATPTFAEGFATALIGIAGVGLLAGSAAFCFGAASAPLVITGTLAIEAPLATRPAAPAWSGPLPTGGSYPTAPPEAGPLPAAGAPAADLPPAGAGQPAPNHWAMRQQQQALLREIQANQALRAPNGQAVLVFQNAGLAINGQPQTAAVAARYRRLLGVPHDPATGKVSGVARIVIH